MARRKKEQIEMPDWVTEGEKIAERALEEQRVLVPVPVRHEEAKHTAYRYLDVRDGDKPWYLQDETGQNNFEEQTWYGKLLTRLSQHIADLLYGQGESLDVDEAINCWLINNRDFYRAILIGVLTEEKIREVLTRDLDEAVVNTIVQIALS